MAYEKDQKILAEVSEAVASVKNGAGLVSRNSIRTDLLKEDPKSFSDESMQYPEITNAVWDENEDLFALSRLCDRFAPEYLKICKTLEKTVEYLGSVCLTKCAMKYYGHDVSMMSKITAESLHRMVSFNFRKVRAALDEKKEREKIFDLDLYNQMLSFARVMKRLSATEDRVVSIKLGLEEPHGLTKHARSFRKSGSDSEAPLRELPSYSIDYSALKAMAAESIPAPAPAEMDEQVCEVNSGAEGQQAEEAPMPLPEDAGKSETDEQGSEDLKLSTEPPAFEEILQRAMAREGKSEEAELCLTLEEMQFLSTDRCFQSVYPDLAAEIRNILREVDSG